MVQAGVGDQDSAVPGLLPASIRATWLGTGHVHLVEGDGDPAGQQLLQLHPQHVAILLQGGDTGDSHPHPAGEGCRGQGKVTLNRTWQPL